MRSTRAGKHSSPLACTLCSFFICHTGGHKHYSPLSGTLTSSTPGSCFVPYKPSASQVATWRPSSPVQPVSTFIFSQPAAFGSPPSIGRRGYKYSSPLFTSPVGLHETRKHSFSQAGICSPSSRVNPILT